MATLSFSALSSLEINSPAPMLVASTTTVISPAASMVASGVPAAISPTTTPVVETRLSSMPNIIVLRLLLVVFIGSKYSRGWFAPVLKEPRQGFVKTETYVSLSKHFEVLLNPILWV